MEKYNLAGEVLPHTAIIDPRTGAQLVKVLCSGISRPIPPAIHDPYMILHGPIWSGYSYHVPVLFLVDA